MLVTAIALFFSTFSTPLLSAALTFGIFVVGHFNADLKNFEQSSTPEPALAGARRLLRAAGPRGVRHQDRGRARPAGGAGYIAATVGYGLAYIAVLLVLSIADLLAAGLQMRRRRRRRSASRSRSRCCCRSHRAADGAGSAYPRDESAERRVMYVQSPGGARPHRARLRRAGRRRLLDPRSQHYGGDRLSRRRSAATSSSIRCST